jgi:hypothetical protein
MQYMFRQGQTLARRKPYKNVSFRNLTTKQQAKRIYRYKAITKRKKLKHARIKVYMYKLRNKNKTIELTTNIYDY